MSSPLVVSTGYTPHPLQAVLHRNVRRFNVMCCHRGFGKTVFAVNELVDRGLRNQNHNPIYAYIATSYGQAKRVAWDQFKEAVRDIPGVETNESDLRIDIPRADKRDKIRIHLLGSENPGALKGLHLDGVVIDEFSEMEPSIWGVVVRPMLTRKKGWAVFIGTPKGQNHFEAIYRTAETQMRQGHPDWFAAMYKGSESGILPLSELEAARLTMSQEEYDQEIECSFSAAMVGAYYGKEMNIAAEEGRITRVPYDPTLATFTYWDLGIDDQTVIWIGQKLGSREVRWIDYIENSGESLEWYIKELQMKGYVYEEHVLPHDAGARELGTGKTREEVLRKKGLGKRTRVLKRSNIEDGINAVRNMIKKSWFDAVKCERGINALKSYERKWDAKNKNFKSRPLHNWASHGADAFRTAAMGMDEYAPEDRDRKNLQRYSVRDFDVV